MTAPSEGASAMLEFVRAYVKEKRYAPTAREIQAGLGLASLATVHRRLRALQRAGLIDWPPGMHRGIRVMG